MAASEFVRYERGEIVDVEEFGVATAILRGDTQLLSQEVESKHLFELCMTFGHQSTAAALLIHKVPGCRVEFWHLGPFAKHVTIGGYSMNCTTCGVSWRTCAFCCWGWEVKNGVWMKDWNSELEDAVASARKAAERPVARAVLAVLRLGEDFRNFDVSEAAMARLLDLAILTGDADLAQRRAQRCTRRPLRRWCSGHFFEGGTLGPISVSQPDVMAAAILSGIALQGLSVRIVAWDSLSIPLRDAFFWRPAALAVLRPAASRRPTTPDSGWSRSAFLHLVSWDR